MVVLHYLLRNRVETNNNVDNSVKHKTITVQGPTMIMNMENMAHTAKKTLKNHFESYVNVIVETCVETR